MTSMRPARPLLIGLAGALLALPALAPAETNEVGTSAPQATPSCPSLPCRAIPRTTGYQAKVGTSRGLMEVKRDGRLVSWTITLAKPGPKQIAFFDDKLGGESMAQITVLKPGRKLRYRVVSHGELVRLRPYFGRTVEIALERTLRVRKGWVIGLTVPTWAPALAINLPGDTSWRASRGKGECDGDDLNKQTAARPGTIPQFYCLYRGARLTYSARVVPTPPGGEPKTVSEKPRS